MQNKIEEYDYKQIAILGKSFLDAAKICDNPTMEEVGWNHDLIVPIITNMSFACELFLKAILKHDDIQQKKMHKLAGLFNELGNDRKREIVRSENAEEFMIKLTNISNLFEEWRYIYERYPSSVEYNFLCDLSDRLLSVVEGFERSK